MKRERGQAVVFMAIALVGLLGFSALALDGGLLFTERRRAQNVADNAALAGALKAAQTPDTPPGAADAAGVADALAIAASNGYTNDGLSNTVVVSKPPSAGTYAGDDEYIEVTITQTVQTSFVHFVWPGPVSLTVRAVAKSLPSTYAPIVAGQALVALNSSECSALWFTGSYATTINGGGAFSNSSCAGSAGRRGGSGSVSVSGGGINIVGGWEDDGGSGSVSPAPTTGVAPLDPLPSVPPPPCSSLPDRGSYHLSNGVEGIDPGRYSRITTQPGSTLYLNPGLYCLTGDFEPRGGLIGYGVVFYLQDGGFHTNASAQNSLSAPTAGSCAATTPEVCDYVGMLIFFDPGNSNPADLNGNGSTGFAGTIFAPSSLCTINGVSGNIGLSSQIMCGTVKVSGNATVSISYNPGDNFQVRKPPDIQLTE